jgi:hypothetical protein
MRAMKSWLWKGMAAATVALPALSGISPASASSFTWDPSQASPPLSGSAFTADTINTTNYLQAIHLTNGSFVETFILQINGFQLNGQPVTAPGFNSNYGLYFTINATGQAASFNTLNIALMADPGNNDGTPSAGITGVSFSNTGPTGVADDVTLGTGTLVSASLTFNPVTMVRNAHFVENFASAPNETGFFGSISPLLEEFLTTPPSAFQTFLEPDGSSIDLVNGGSGRAEFVPEPGSLVLLASSLLGLGLASLFRAGSPAARDRNATSKSTIAA